MMTRAGIYKSPYEPFDWEKFFRIVRSIAAGAFLGALASLAVYSCLFVFTLTKVAAGLPAVVDKAVAREAEATRQATSDQITAIAGKVDGQLTTLQTNLFARVDKIEGDANTQLTDIRTAAVTQIADTRTALVGQLNNVTVPAAAALNQVNKDLLPATKTTITNAGNLLKDGQDSLDDSYWDIKGLLSSATVAATQAAQTMETVNKQTPILMGHVSGIAGDFHDATHNLDIKYFHPPPMTKKQKVAAFFSNFETILIAALRGGVF
jgi:Skp family chaperone for outer membrane proteins